MLQLADVKEAMVVCSLHCVQHWKTGNGQGKLCYVPHISRLKFNLFLRFLKYWSGHTCSSLHCELLFFFHSPTPNIGDPSVFGNLPPHPAVIEGARQALESGKHNGYGHSSGIPHVREAVAKEFSRPGAPLTGEVESAWLCNRCQITAKHSCKGRLKQRHLSIQDTVSWDSCIEKCTKTAFE